MLFTILGSFCFFLDWIRANIWPQNKHRKTCEHAPTHGHPRRIPGRILREPTYQSHQHLIPVTYSVHARIQREKGAECLDPLKNHKKNRVPFFEILVQIRWKITKLPSQHSMLGHHRLPGELKWRFTGRPMMALF